MADRPIVVEGDAARNLIDRMSTYESRPIAWGQKRVRAIKMTRPFVVVQDGNAPIRGRLECDAGCYLVLSPQRTLYPVPGDVFEYQYAHTEGQT